MTDVRLHALAIGVTAFVHIGVVGGVAAMNAFDRSPERKAKLADESFRHIEAGLAIRRKDAAGQKSRLPQKDRAPKAKPPDAPGVALDPNRAPSEKKKQDAPPPEVIDPNATFEKFRKAAEATGEAPGGAGADDETQGGADEGSEWGTLEDARGDPYVGQLVGRMTTNPDLVVPSVVTETGLETWGCVKLHPDGRIAERAIDDDHKSGNRTFNRAVEERLRLTTDMDEPVPPHLVDLLVKRGICVPYRY